jgi:hypothetical protein
MKKILIIPLFILLTGNFSFASFDFNQNCKNAYDKIISLRFDEGIILLDSEKTVNPNNKIVLYLEDYIDFLKLIISEDASLYYTLQDNKEARIDKIEETEEESPYYNYCLAEINLHWAFARMKFQDYITSATEINKAYKLLVKNQENYPSFVPNYKGLGVLHSLIGTIPDEYSWATSLIGISGTITQGVNELSTVLTTAQTNPEYKYLETETIFMLTFIQLNLQSDKEAALKLGSYLENEEYSVKAKTNPLLAYAAASIAVKTGSNDKAIEILLARPTGTEYYPFYYLDYLTGVAKLNKLEFDAYKYIYSFILNFKGQNYIKAAYQKLAWYYLINNNTSKYKEKIAYAVTLGSNIVDEDKQAKTEGESLTVPNIRLLKARLLFDGSYYQDALDMLQEKLPSTYCVSTKDYLEYTYRIGRIYDEWGYDSKAIPFYELTVKNGSIFTYYFAANASLHLGMIYENLGSTTKAKYYYELCGQMKNTEYKNSINQKAKAGLNRLQ